MTELLVSPWVVAGLFLLVAIAYSSVGLGGGSTYTALMAILGFNALAIPLLSLTLNLFVTSIGSYSFLRYRHARFRLIAPFLVSSIPMAYLGGSLQLHKTVFYGVLLVSLLFIATRIYLWDRFTLRVALSRKRKLLISLFSGALLGLIAGIVGIGGGIFLVPLIIVLGLGSEKEAAACGAIFIWLNSLSALVARLQYNAIDLLEYWPLIMAVVIGAALGSFMGAAIFSPRQMQKILGGIILVAIAFLASNMLADL